MTCSRIENLLSAYIDNELNKEEYFAVRRHLTICSECNQLYEDLVSVKKCFDNLNIAEPPEDMIANIKTAILSGEVKTKKSESASQWWRSVFNFTKYVIPAAMIGTAVAIPIVTNITKMNLFTPFVNSNEVQPQLQASLSTNADTTIVSDNKKTHSSNDGIINSSTLNSNVIKLTNASTNNSTIYKNNLGNYINKKKSYSSYDVELYLDEINLAHYINSWFTEDMSDKLTLVGNPKISWFSLNYNF